MVDTNNYDGDKKNSLGSENEKSKTWYSNNEKEEIIKVLIEQEKKIEKHGKKLQEQSDTFEQQAVKMVDQGEKLEKSEYNLVGLLGIFIAIFTFISVEVSILKTITGFFRISGITIIMLSSIILLLWYMQNFLISQETKKNYKVFWGILGLLIVGICLVGFGDFRNPAEIKNNSDFITLKNSNIELENKIKNIERQLEIQNEIEQLKEEKKNIH